MNLLDKPLPQPTPETLPFWDGARRQQLLMPYCESCQRYVFYPRSRCPDCWKGPLDWRVTRGDGMVYSYTVAEIPSHPAFAEDVPYVIALVELHEGPRLTTNIVGCEPSDVHIGMAVTAVYEAVSPDVTLVKFEPC